MELGSFFLVLKVSFMDQQQNGKVSLHCKVFIYSSDGAQKEKLGV